MNNITGIAVFFETKLSFVSFSIIMEQNITILNVVSC